MFNNISLSTLSNKVRLLMLMVILFFMALPFFMMSATSSIVDAEGVEVAGYIWTDNGNPDNDSNDYIWTD